MLDDFVFRAVLAGLGVVLAAAPLGCFVVWRRMAYFGDATAHVAVLGVALSLMLAISIPLGVFFVVLTLVLLLHGLSARNYDNDTLLGVLAHGGLAGGLVAISFVPGVRIDLEAFLFGDILAVGKLDLLIIWCGALCVLGLLFWRWSALLTATLSAELAQAAGLDARREELILNLALAVVVAVALQVVGALLITALLIIPAAAARVFATSPERMVLIAAGVGAVSVFGGMEVSIRLDTPTGPTIVLIAITVFALSAIWQSIRGR